MRTASNPDLPVEPIGGEVLRWRPQQPEMFSRAELKRQTGDYKAAVPAQISNLPIKLSGELASLVEDASGKIRDFDKKARMVLGSENPMLGPMSSILLRTESASSSQIEQITSSAKQLALAELHGESKSNAETVIGNVRAMQAAMDLSSELSEQSLLKMHKALMANQSGFQDKYAGHYRDQQVWIGKGSAGPLTAEFVPPHQKRISQAMKDLVEFLQREDIPVLAQASIAHAQFETIHPFIDGNGRTGRALVHSVMKNKGLVSSSAIPLSAGLLTNLSGYFESLGTFRSGDAGPLIRQFANAAHYAAATGEQLVDDLIEQMEISKQMLSGVRSDSAAWRVLPELIAQPVINSNYLITTLGLNEMTAIRAIKTLENRGVIRELTGWRRRRAWEHSGILNALDEFGSKIRRESR